MSRIRTRAAVALTILIATASVVSLPAQKKDDRKPQEGALTPAQNAELAPVILLVDEVMKGAAPAGTYTVPGTPPKDAATPVAPQAVAAPGDVVLAWKNDFLKGQNGMIYTPFTVSVDPGKLTANAVVGYLRVAAKGTTAAPTPAPKAAAAAAADPKDKKKKDSKDAKETKAPESLYPFEDVYFTDFRGAAGQPLKMSRAFAVAPGDYDVYFAVRERPAASATGGAAAAADAPVRIVVHKQELTVPNYHSDELQTSSIIVAEKIEQLATPLPPEAIKERPYVLGEAEIVPAADLKFKKTEEISVVFQVYGVKFGEDKKPDLVVEYAFLQKDASGEKPFNNTPPQAFNGQTLPPNFDPALGHQIVGGQAVPLASFPEGDFRLAIKITDNKAGKSITRDVLFSVVPAS
jgi:hypothetical protein